jgi:hypothetical protein
MCWLAKAFWLKRVFVRVIVPPMAGIDGYAWEWDVLYRYRIMRDVCSISDEGTRIVYECLISDEGMCSGMRTHLHRLIYIYYGVQMRS